MATLIPTRSTCPLHCSLCLPDDIWVKCPKILTLLNTENCQISVSDINDSEVYSTAEEIDTSCLFSDQSLSNTQKLEEARRKLSKVHGEHHAPQVQNNTDEHVEIKPKSSADSGKVDVKSIRFAIDSLSEGEAETKTYRNFSKRRSKPEQHVHAGVNNHSEFDQIQDSFSSDFNSFIRMASESTKNVFRKIKSADLAPKNFWKRNRPETPEYDSNESLSSAGSATLYHLPQESSPVTDASPGDSMSTAETDMSHGEHQPEVHPRLESNWVQRETQESHGLLRRKASEALRYVQKLKVGSKVGALLPRNKSRAGGTGTHAEESAWNPQAGRRGKSSQEDVRKQLARSLSF